MRAQKIGRVAEERKERDVVDLMADAIHSDPMTTEGRAAIERSARELMLRGVIEHKVYDSLTKGLHGARMERHMFAVQEQVKELRAAVDKLNEERARLAVTAGPAPGQLPYSEDEDEPADDECASPSDNSKH